LWEWAAIPSNRAGILDGSVMVISMMMMMMMMQQRRSGAITVDDGVALKSRGATFFNNQHLHRKQR
jgi:hypothetical protein